MTIAVRIFTDPFCPWSWASEPHLRRLQTEFGEQVRVTFVLVAMFRELTDPVGLALSGLDAAAASGMPVDARGFLSDPPRSTQPACMAVLGAAEQGAGAPYLRRLREAIWLERRRMDSGPALLDAARETDGLDVARLEAAFGSSALPEALGADLERGRAVDPAHRAPATGRVALPSLEAVGADGAVRGAYGFGPFERWREAIVAAGGVPRPSRPGVEEALARWGALATAELAAACDLPGPLAPAELWRLALEWRVRYDGALWRR